ncbi:MAG: hypothetical protein K2W80_18035, partial [Burkholderiales bacterium]|nr:hypothetical protein [Burkholderiales bacterium]
MTTETGCRAAAEATLRARGGHVRGTGGLTLALAAACVLALPAGGAAAAAAPEFPTRAMRFIVPFAPGGPTDVAARVIGQKMAESWGHPVIVDNRAGAGGNIGMALAAKAPPDGHTV